MPAPPDPRRSEAFDLFEQNVNVSEVARRLGIPRSTAAGWRDAWLLARKAPPTPSQPSKEEVQAMQIAALESKLKIAEGTARVTPAYTPPPSSSPEARWKAAELDNAEHIKRALLMAHFTVELPSEPCAITFVSDQHISLGNTVDLQRMRADAEMIGDTDGVYAVLGGDAVDNHCLDPATEVLTTRGWKFYHETSPDDQIVGLRPDRTCEWQPRGTLVLGEYNDEMIRVASESISMAVTAEHRVAVQYGDSHKEAIGSRLEYTSGWRLGERKSWIPISASSGRNDSPFVSDDELRVVGWVLTDGWIHYGRARTDGSRRQYYSIAQRVSNCEQIAELLTRLGYRHSTHDKRQKCGKICGTSIKTAEVLRTFSITGDGAERLVELIPTKERLPSWVFNLSDRQFAVLLETLIEGDGSRNGRSYILYGKADFLDQVQAACVTHGLAAKIQKVPGRSEVRLLINPKLAEQIQPNKTVVLRDHHAGVVWCLKTRLGNFLARRDGKPFFTGNCKHRSAVLAARSTPSDQFELFEWYLSIFAHRVLVAISGNHDLWTNQLAGVDVLSILLQKQRVCYAPDEALLDLRVGQQPYKVGIRHQYRFNSTLNECHSPKQWFRNGECDWDIGCVCHHHLSAVEPFWGHGIERWACRPGSYQITSAYSRQFGFSKTRPMCPTFILYPDRREIVGFHDLRPALRMLKAERG